jgi:hypothetical protein
MLLDAMLQLLGMKQLRHPTQVSFDGKTLVPGAPRTALDILCWGVLLTKALVGQKVKCLFGTVAQQPLEPRPFG